MLTHVDEHGKATMVDVSAKKPTFRKAYAKGSVHVGKKVLNLIKKNEIKKGDVLNTSKIAGILAAKKVGELIPLCHPLNISFVDIKFQYDDIGESILIFSEVALTGATGVEMEALTAVEIAALTIYDMCKGVDKAITIGECFLIKKTGGKSGTFRNIEKIKGYINSATEKVKGEKEVEIIGILPDFINEGDRVKIEDEIFKIFNRDGKTIINFHKSYQLKKGVKVWLII